MKRQTKLILFAVVLLIAAFFRFYHITTIPPGLYPDEAVNGTNAQEAIQTGEYKLFYPENNGREGLFMNIQSLSIRAFGNKPWALRVVSAIFGTLTVLGVYLLTKELFRTPANQEARSTNPNVILRAEPEGSRRFFASLRMTPANLPRIPRDETIALLASFFLATSFWHINFSRIGFRAITLPFFLTFGFYFLYRMLRSLREDPPTSIRAELYAVLGGIFYGLGFHGYIAYRVTPLLLIVPFMAGWRNWRAGSQLGNLVSNWKLSFQVEEQPDPKNSKCFPCLFLLFLFTACVIALPIGYYFLTHPQDFSGRTAQVSILSSSAPARTLALNVVKTIGMFFAVGDYNWRHNFSGVPELWWPVSILFLAGIVISLKRILIDSKHEARNSKQIINPNDLNSTQSRISDFGFRILKILTAPEFLLLWWLAVLAIPVIISAEGLPHALRAIGMVVPALILAALGLDWLLTYLQDMHARWLERYPHKRAQLMRLQREGAILFGVCLIAIAAHTYNQYFFDWGHNPEVADAFSERYTHIGGLLAALPRETQKYVIVNKDALRVRDIPMPAQPIMFALGDGIATRAQVTSSNTRYLLPEDVPLLAGPLHPRPGSVLVLLEEDMTLWQQIHMLLPTLTITVSQDGILLGNL